MNTLKDFTVLFLEDNKVFAEHTIYFLELYVKKVIHCTNMKDAFEIFQTKEIDIIISDLKVEDGIALSLIENIRNLEQKVPIVLLSAPKDDVTIKDEYAYHYDKKIVFRDNIEIVLSKKEALFVELLIKNKNGITTKEDINSHIWEDEFMSESALKNFLLRVRKKLGKDFFYTVQNIGYRF